MKRLGLILFFVSLLSAVEAQTIRDRIIQRRENRGAPAVKTETPPPPNYNDLYYWAAHPLKKDMSDTIPSFLKNEKRDSAADVFFIYPTSYTKDMRNAAANASLQDTALNNETDSRSLLYQASIFNGSAKVYAPRYRQAHLKNFFSPNSEEAQKAFDLAYSDIKAAFEYYLAHYNQGRPIIIAGHSQGSMHAIRLLQEFFDGKPLQKQLVCAYVVGYQIKTDDFKHIPVGDRPDATGCFVGWRTFKKGETGPRVNAEKGGSVCVNPVTWTTSTEESKKEDHKGAIGRDFDKPLRKLLTASIDPEHKILWVDLPDKLEEKIGDRMKNFHIADLNLFWLDVRENVRVRVNRFLEEKSN